MLYRGLYHFSVAYDKGKATDPVKYFAAKENQDLGVVKSLRKPVPKLDLSPFPLPPADIRAVCLTYHRWCYAIRRRSLNLPTHCSLIKT
jgi:hypothetical protein